MRLCLVTSVKYVSLDSCQRFAETYNAERTGPVSLAVPIWSTSFKIPCTFALILKTCRDNEDCKDKKADSSRDCGRDEVGACGGWAKPVSIS